MAINSTTAGKVMSAKIKKARKTKLKSQKKTVSGENFKLIREHMVRMSREECAAYLRVHVATLRKWESGTIPVPFAVFELLRLLFENVQFKLSHDSWQGWFINSHGKLVSPERGNLSFSPSDLSFIRETHQANEIYRSEIKRLEQENKKLNLQLSIHKIVRIETESNTINYEEKAA